MSKKNRTFAAAKVLNEHAMTQKTTREWFDRLCRSAIKMLMLTGVTFTMATCYGPPPERQYGEEPEWQEDQEQVENTLIRTEKGS